MAVGSRKKPAHINSLAVILYPHETEQLDKGDTEKSYNKHVPALFELAGEMANLLRDSSYVQISRSDSNPKKLYPPTYTIDKHSEHISITRMCSVLLGRHRLQISNRRVTYREHRRKYKLEDGIRYWQANNHLCDVVLWQLSQHIIRPPIMA